METKQFYQEKSFLSRIYTGKKIRNEMNLIADSLNQGNFPFPIPENSGSAHIFPLNYDSEPTQVYVVNFFKESNPEEVRVSRGSFKIHKKDLTKLLSSSQNR